MWLQATVLADRSANGVTWQEHVRQISEAHWGLSIALWLCIGAAITTRIAWPLFQSRDSFENFLGFEIMLLGTPIWIGGTMMIGLALGIVQ